MKNKRILEDISQVTEKRFACIPKVFNTRHIKSADCRLQISQTGPVIFTLFVDSGYKQDPEIPLNWVLGTNQTDYMLFFVTLAIEVDELTDGSEMVK